MKTKPATFPHPTLRYFQGRAYLQGRTHRNSRRVVWVYQWQESRNAYFIKNRRIAIS